MRNFLFLLLLSNTAHAADCRTNSDRALNLLKTPTTEGELRSEEGKCLLRYRLGEANVTQAALKIIRDSREDILLREDLIEAFADSPLRKSIKVEGTRAPALDKQDKLALDRTVSGAQDLLQLTQAMESMDEVVTVTRHEQEFFRAISDIALDDSNPVLLRAKAVAALEQAAKKVYSSGLYDDRGIRQVQETLQTVANRGDTGSYYTGAAEAYGRMASSGLPSFQRLTVPGRALASEKSKE